MARGSASARNMRKSMGKRVKALTNAKRSEIRSSAGGQPKGSKGALTLVPSLVDTKHGTVASHRWKNLSPDEVSSLLKGGKIEDNKTRNITPSEMNRVETQFKDLSNKTKAILDKINSLTLPTKAEGEVSPERKQKEFEQRQSKYAEYRSKNKKDSLNYKRDDTINYKSDCRAFLTEQEDLIESVSSCGLTYSNDGMDSPIDTIKDMKQRGENQDGQPISVLLQNGLAGSLHTNRGMASKVSLLSDTEMAKQFGLGGLFPKTSTRQYGYMLNGRQIDLEGTMESVSHFRSLESVVPEGKRGALKLFDALFGIRREHNTLTNRNSFDDSISMDDIDVTDPEVSSIIDSLDANGDKIKGLFTKHGVAEGAHTMFKSRLDKLKQKRDEKSKPRQKPKTSVEMALERLVSKTTAQMESNLREIKQSKEYDIAKSSRKSWEEVTGAEFDEWVERGINMEYPEVASSLDTYVQDNNKSGIKDAMEKDEYGAYYAQMQRTLKTIYPNGIPVRRITGYAGGTGEGADDFVSVSIHDAWGEGKTVSSHVISPEDVVAVGSGSEGELIIKRSALKKQEKTAKRTKVEGTTDRKKAKTIRENMRSELDLYSHYLTTDTASRMHKFIDSYHDTISGIGDVSAKELDDLGIDMVKKLMHQEVESNRNSFTDHGIRHVTSNIETMNQILDQGKEVGPKMRLMGMVAMVNHDMGYTTESVRSPGMRGIKASKYHPKLSARLFEATRSGYKGVFSESELSDVTELIATHSDHQLATGTDSKSRLTNSVKLADDLALYHKEKLPSMFKYVDGGDKLLVDIGKAAKSGNQEEFDRLRGVLVQSIEKSKMDSNLKRDLTKATERISPKTHEFTMGALAGEIESIGSSSDGLININIQHNEMDQILSSVFDMGQRQAKALLKDYGHDTNNIPNECGKLASSYKLDGVAKINVKC